MKILWLLSVAVLSLSPLSLHASPSDAVSVLQECGTPLSDTIADAAGGERVLKYRQATLHFTPDSGGWTFLSATRGREGFDQINLQQVMPCFRKAMTDVPIYTPAENPVQTSAPANPTPMAPMQIVSQDGAPMTFSARLWAQLASYLYPLSRTTLMTLVLLYLLPSFVGVIRRPAHLGALVTIDILFGWTLLGWIVSLILAFGEQYEPGRQGSFAVRMLVPSGAGAPLRLNLMDAATEESVMDEEVVEEERAPQLRPLPAGQSGPFVAYRKPQIEQIQDEVPDPLPASVIARRRSAITLPLDPNQHLGEGYSLSAPKVVVPDPEIDWVEQYFPRRLFRMEVITHTRQVTLFEVGLTCRGVDSEGKEYLGGMIGKEFRIFPRDRVLQMHECVA